jgi:hypothetical protein
MRIVGTGSDGALFDGSPRHLGAASSAERVKEIGVVHYGLGPIGLAVARLAILRGLRAVGAIDRDPAMIGQSLGSLLDAPGDEWPLVERHYKSHHGAEVAFHCTGSRIKEVLPELLECIGDGLNVISSCEELTYPWAESTDAALEIDEAARIKEVTVLGTGINPGFAMDYLPVALAAVSGRVDHVKVVRLQDAGSRRISLQRKIGVGLDLDSFRARAASGTMGHVGLRQSAHGLAAALGWSLTKLQESIDPVCAAGLVPSALGDISPGKVIGLRHQVRGFQAEREVIFLDLQMVLGLRRSSDRVEVRGEPTVKLSVPGGLHGDTATAAIIVNAVPMVLRAPPGLTVMTDLPPPHPYEGGSISLVATEVMSSGA